MRSVILRLFEPAPGAGRVELCGLVEDVRTGARWPFRGDDQLLTLLARAAAADSSGPGAETPAENRWP